MASPWRRSTIVTALALSANLGACETQKKGVEALPASLQPAPSANVRFFTVKNPRCPYWVDPFPARDGRQGGAQCVNRETLTAVCAAAHCEAQAGRPDRDPAEAPR